MSGIEEEPNCEDRSAVPLAKLKCSKHTDQHIAFICISHENCSNQNLLCIECIDQLMGDDHHQLISVKKFSKFIRDYHKRSISSIQKTKNLVNKIRAQINERIDDIQIYSFADLEQLKISHGESQSEMKKILMKMAQKKVWTKLQAMNFQTEEFYEHIASDVQKSETDIQEVLDKLLKFTEKCFKVLEQGKGFAENQSENNFDEELELKDRLRRRKSCNLYLQDPLRVVNTNPSNRKSTSKKPQKSIRPLSKGDKIARHQRTQQKIKDQSDQIVDPGSQGMKQNEQEERQKNYKNSEKYAKNKEMQNQPIEEEVNEEGSNNLSQNEGEEINQDQSSIHDSDKIAYRQPKQNLIKFKRYSIEEKVKILAQVNLVGKKAVARRHKIAASTLLRWQKNRSLFKKVQKAPLIHKNHKNKFETNLHTDKRISSASKQRGKLPEKKEKTLKSQQKVKAGEPVKSSQNSENEIKIEDD